MIKSFANKVTEHLFHGIASKESRHFPQALHRIAFRKLMQLDMATQLQTLNVPPGNRLEALKGDLEGLHSIRINNQFRICFRWTDDGVYDVHVTDYH